MARDLSGGVGIEGRQQIHQHYAQAGRTRQYPVGPDRERQSGCSVGAAREKIEHGLGCGLGRRRVQGVAQAREDGAHLIPAVIFLQGE